MMYLTPPSLYRNTTSLLLLFVACFCLTACQSDSEAKETNVETSIAVLTTYPKAATLRLPTFAGETQAHFEHQLSFQISGRISERLISAGDTVTKGQPMFKLDNQDNLLRLEQAQTVLSATQQRLETVQAQLKRTKKLHARDLTSKANLENLQAALEEAHARQVQAQAELELAQNHLSYTIINSPIDGFVIDTFVETEAIVSQGQTIASVGSKDGTDVVVDLPESWLPAPIRGHVHFSDGQIFPVELYEHAMQANPTTRTWQTRYSINGQPPKGFGRLVQLQLEKQNDMPGRLLSLPISALDERGQGAQIWQVTSDGVTSLPIHVLQLLPDRFIFQAQNIDESMLVVAAGTHKLRANLAVKPIKAQ